ncbi:MAG: GtrA family protein [Desulfovibrionaceae bacterium]|jgi:putative flippase GtrA|nr:GtrA family protein [Desulfovibrionaceae bacterium]
MGCEALRYLAAGGVNTLLTYLLYLGLLRLLDYRLAYVLAFVAGVLLSYGLLRHLVFARAGRRHALLRVAASHLLQLALGLVIVQLWVGWWRQPAWLAPVVAAAVCVPLIFFLQRRIFTPHVAH